MSDSTDDQELLRQYLVGRDVPCPKCGYDLRGLEGVKCPECGRPVRLCIECRHAAIAAWVAGTIALAATGGFNGMLLLLFGFWRWPFVWDEDVAMFATGLGLSLVALSVWICIRRWHLRRLACWGW